MKNHRFLTVSLSGILCLIFSSMFSVSAQTENWKQTIAYNSISDALNAQLKGETVYKLHLNGDETTIADTTIVLLSDLKSLSIGRIKNLTELPAHITQLTSLEELYLDLPNLCKLPEDLHKLQNLRSLSIFSAARDLQYPERVFELPLLEELNLINMRSRNELPNSFAKLEKLKELTIDSCNTIRFPEQFKPAFLQNVLIRNCDSIDMPSLLESLSFSDSLKNLEIIQCNVKEIPAEIGKLKSLVNFSSNENPIKHVQDGFGQLENLESLTFIGSSIASLPESMLGLKKLRSLNIGSTVSLNMEGIIDLASRMNISHLSISSPKNKYLPNNIGKLKQLEGLDLSGNTFETLPASLCSLTNLLYLTLPKCKRLPNDFHKLKNVEHLNFSYNEIGLEELPANVWEINEIQYDFTGNKLKSLPEFNKYYGIQILRLTGNELESIPSSISNLSDLVILNLDMNNLKKIPESMKAMDNLKFLGISGMSSLNLKQAFTIIKEMKGLERLDISKSYISNLPGIAFECNQLKYIAILDDDGSFYSVVESIEELKNISVAEPLAQIDVPLYVDTISYYPHLAFSVKRINQMKKFGSDIYFATQMNGIFHYNTKSGVFDYLNTYTSSIPSDNIKSVTLLDGKLYAIGHVNGVSQFMVYDGSIWHVQSFGHKGLTYATSSIFSDLDSNLWIWGYDVLARYKDGIFTYFTKDNSPVSGVPGVFYADKKGNIWLSSNNSILRFSEEKGWDEYKNVFTDAIYATLVDFEENENGDILAVLNFDKYAVFKNEIWTQFSIPKCIIPNIQKVEFRESDSTMVFAGEYVLSFVKSNACRHVRLARVLNEYTFEMNNIQVGDTSIWMCSSDQIMVLRNGMDEIQKLEAGTAPFCKNEIKDLKWFRDNLYILAGEHVYIQKNQSFTELPAPPIKSGNSIVFDSEGNLYLCGLGIACYNGLNWIKISPEFFGDNDFISHIAFDKKNNLWASNQSGLSCKIGNEWKFYSKRDLKVQVIQNTYLLSSPKSEIWYSTGMDLIRVDKKPVKFSAFVGYGERVSSFAFDRKGKIWIGSEGKGVGLVESNSIPLGFKKPSVDISSIVDMCFDSDDNLWALSSEALYKISDSEWTQYWKSNNREFSFSCLEVVGEQIYVGTNAGLLVLSKK